MATTDRPAPEPDRAPCPCGRGDSYGDCCGPLHRGERRAPSAEALMRSRYTAFAIGDAGHLVRSWHPSTAPEHVDLDPEEQWDRLEIVATTGGGPFDSEGTVTFRAHHHRGGRAGVLAEHSRFVREDGRWLYLDGS
ncbi:hypothetical protein DW322_17900 [Rhodococcus rhodnii]|nr:YchJ family metal-binding protein [Rhodococcus rhodnii]TXG91719.1 hypothetical protein DW322_17900 [Rhodococcus rhodnii]